VRYLPVAALLLLACSGKSPPAPAPTEPSPERIATLNTQLPTLLGKYHIAAIGVAVIRAGQLVWSNAYGEQAPGVPASTETLFNIASMTKPISAETVLRLASLGKLSLDAPMASDWVDPDVAGDPRHLKLTPRIALSHQTGFPNWRRMNPNRRLAFQFDPGTRFGYSGEGYNYVARFAEKRLGTDFETLAEQQVFDPIGMKHTAYSERPWMQGHLAIPMDTLGKWGDQPDLSPSGEWNAADDIYTTLHDYAAFMISVMKGEGLTPELAAERMKMQTTIANEWPCVVQPATRCPSATGMALGWFRFDYGSEPVIWHGGDDWGEHGLAYFYPRTRDGFIVLINGGNGRYAELDALDLLDDRTPVASFQGTSRSPLATWFRALLDAAYAGTLPQQSKK
jgi:CubicO group peptidase (beta-lactamase class C family)